MTTHTPALRYCPPCDADTRVTYKGHGAECAKCGRGYPKDGPRSKSDIEDAARHTPGPWTVSPRDLATVLGTAQPDRPYSVVVAECPGYKSDREANARLIAAAPEMLDLLRDVCAAWGNADTDTDYDLLNRSASEARALLARIDAP